MTQIVILTPEIEQSETEATGFEYIIGYEDVTTPIFVVGRYIADGQDYTVSLIIRHYLMVYITINVTVK